MTVLSFGKNQNAANYILIKSKKYLDSLTQIMILELQENYGKEGIKLLQDKMAAAQQMPTFEERLKILLLEVYFFKKDFNPILSYGKYSYYKACLKDSNYKVDSVHQEVDYKKLWEFQKIEEQKYLDHYNCLQKYYTNCCWKFYFYCWKFYFWRVNFKKLLKFRKTTTN